MKNSPIKLTNITKLVFLVILTSLAFTVQMSAQHIDESFEGAWPPTGWVVTNNGTGNDWTQNTNSSYSHTGSKSAVYEYDEDNNADTWLFTKGVNLASGEMVNWSFYERVADSDYTERLKFTVGTAQTVAGQTTTLLDLNSLDNTAWDNKTGTYTAPSTGTYYFAFNCYSVADMWNLYVDDLFVETITCPDPTSQTADNISGLTADLSWTDDFASLWDIEWGDKNFSLGNGTTVTGVTKPYTVTVGTHGNEYDFYVRADCDSGDYSNWVGPYTWVQVDIPDCPTLDSPSDGAIEQPLNVSLSWTAATTGDPATLYDIYFGTVSGSISYIGSIAGTSTTISGLDLNQTYYWYINPYNTSGANDCSASERSFTTQSAPPGPTGLTCTASSEDLIFVEEFEELGNWTGDVVLFEENGKWIFRRVGSTSSPNTGPDGAYSGIYYMYYEASGNTTDVASAISPAIDLTYAVDEVELSFWMHAYGMGIGTFEVGISENASGPFTNIFTWEGPLQNASDEPWHNVGLDLSSYVGSTIYIEFKQTGIGDYRGDLAIDLVEVKACYSCLAPSNVSSSNVDINTADVTWTDGFGCSSDNTVNVTPAITGSPFSVSCGTEAISLSGLTSSTDYTIEIVNNCSGTPSSSTTFTTKPPNDECSGAYVLTVNDDYACSNVTSGTIKGATQSPGVIHSCYGYEDDDVWFSFIATETSHKVQLLNIIGGGDLGYSVWEGDCSSVPTLISGACASYLNPLYVTGLTIGDTYFVKVYSYANGIAYSSTFDVCVGTSPPTPPNDLLCNAIQLIVDDIPMEFTNTNSTSETNELEGDCWGYLGEFESVWFYFNAPSSGKARVTTDFVTLLDKDHIAIYEVGDCSDMTTLTQIGCDENSGTTGSGNMAVADLENLTPGATYYIQVDGWGDLDDVFKIQVLTICNSSMTVLPASATSTTSSGSCVEGGWTHYYNGSNILLSLKLGASEAVITDVTVDPDGSTDAFYVLNDSDGFPDVSGATGAGFMRRKWNVNASTQPSSDVGVRFYYTQDEFNAMNDEISGAGGEALTGHDAMNFFKVTSGEDPFNIGPGGIASGDYELIIHGSNPQITEWVDGTYGSEFYAEYLVDGFSGGGGGSASGGQLLPIEFGEFSGYATSKANVINWTTYSETNTYLYEVERSINSNVWDKIASKDAAGVSRKELKYSIDDKKPFPVAYYRLRTIDLDGKSTLSKVIQIIRKENEIKVNSIYPNPNNGNFAISFYSPSDEKIKMLLVNSLGIEVFFKDFVTNRGLVIENIYANDLPCGIYSLILIQGSKTITKCIVIHK